MSGSRVVHLTGDFVAASQPWIYDLVRLPGRFESSVVCERRIAEDEYPFAPVTTGLPPARRLSWERASRLASGYGVGRPANRWHSALGRLRPEADVFHAHFGTNAWMAVAAGLSPVVASFYGFDATSKPLLSRWRRQYRELFANGSAFVAEGPAMGRRLEAIGAPGDRIRVLPLIADVEGLQWRPPMSAGPIRVVMAGRFAEKKGFDIGIAAFASALRGSDASLTLMGDGPEAHVLRNLAESGGISAQVRFLPFSSREVYRDLLASSDIVLQPSRTARDGDCEGGAPTVLLDAQAIGTVVVASEHADIPFVVDPGAAYLAPEGDVGRTAESLAAACEGRADWRERSLAGRQHVESQHSPTAVARTRDAIYAEVVQQRG